MKNVPAGLAKMNLLVTDTSRNELFAGEVPATTPVDIGTLGTDGQEVLIYGDNFNGVNKTSFKSFSGFGYVNAEGVAAPIYTGSNVKVLTTGDSIADLGSSGDVASSYTFNTKGWPAHTFAISTQRFDVLPDTGIAGNTTQMLIDRLQSDVIDTGAEVVIIMLGTNDVHAQISESVTIANMQTIVDTVTAAGIKVILTPITYRGDNHPNYTQKIDIINAAYRAITEANESAVITDTFDEFNALAIDETRWREVAIDRLHPNSSGGYLLGRTIAATLDRYVVSEDIETTSLMVNPDFNGVGGGVVLGATGTAPDNWTVYNANPDNGLGVTVETVNGRNSVVLSAGTTYENNGRKAKIAQTIQLPDNTATTEYVAYAKVDVSKEDLDEMASMSLQISPIGSDQVRTFLWNGEDVNSRVTEDVSGYMMFTVPAKLDGATSATLSISMSGRGNHDISITIRELNLFEYTVV